MLERRAMLTGTSTSGDDPTGAELNEPPAIVTEIGAGLETFASAEAYADWLVSQAVERWQYQLGQPAYDWGWWGYEPYLRDGILPLEGDGIAVADNVTMMQADAPLSVADGASVTTADGLPESSSTKTQIAGVDEADLVEVAGDTLYSLAHGRLSIVRGFAEATPELVSQISVAETGRTAGMYLFGDRLTIVSRDFQPTIARQPSRGFPWIYPPVFSQPQTTMTVLDVRDPAEVSVVTRTTVDGALISSRMVDGQLRLVLKHRLELPRPEIIWNDSVEDPVIIPAVPEPEPEVTIGLVAADILIDPRWWPGLPEPIGTYETAEVYATRIRQQVVDAMTPQVYQFDQDGNPFDVATLVDPTAIDIPEPGSVNQLTTVTAFDVTADQPQSVATVGLFTKGSVKVFATANDLYLFDGHYGSTEAPDEVLTWGPLTDVTKITFGEETPEAPPAVAFAAQGLFSGRVLNQFAADEQDGFLRVVTESRGQGSGVVVLQQQGESLVEVGSLGGLAPQEDLYSVRFVGSRAYFVTFRRTDPLFVVDLATPTAPALLGELHVPGFSDHIQPLDQNHLLTIGRDADEQTGVFKGMQVSIFDVTEPTSPSLLHRHTLAGGRGTSTSITGNRWQRGDGDHLALGFFPDQGVITIPVRTDARFIWEPPIGWPIVIDVPIVNILPALTLAEEPGPESSTVAPMEAIGLPTPPRRLPAWLPPRPKPPTQHLEVLSFDIAGGISSLGTIDHDTNVDRAVQIAGHLVGVSASEVTVHEFTDPTTTLGSVRLDAVSIQPMHDLPPAVPQPLPDLKALLDRAVAGLPVHGAWKAKAAETVGDQTVVFAEHASGAVHRLTGKGNFSEEGWAAFGFDGIGNAESTPLARASRGSGFGPAEVAAMQSVLSDTVLERLDMFRDQDGRAKRRGGLFAEVMSQFGRE